jgi:hypothetical protein
MLDPAMHDVGLLLQATLATVARTAVGAVSDGVPADILTSKAWQRERCQ